MYEKLRYDAVLLADSGERGDRLVEMLSRVSGRYLHADARLPFGNHRETETHHVDPFCKHVPGDVVRKLGITEHDRHNRVRAWLDKTCVPFEGK